MNFNTILPFGTYDNFLVSYDLESKEVLIYVEHRIYDQNYPNLYTDELIKLFTCQIGDNILDFISIPFNELNNIITYVNNNSKEKLKETLYDLNDLYLYLVCDSLNKNSLTNECNSKLEYISSETLFALEFCCSVDCYPNLQSLSPIQRHYLYCYLYPDNFHTNSFTPEASRRLILEPNIIPDEIKTMTRLKKDYYDENFNHEPVLKKCIISDNVVTKLSSIDVKPIYYYQCSNLSEYIRSEFMKMIELNIRIKKCKNCDKYFVLKGDYATDYCDRIPTGENYTCKRIAAIKARKIKVKDSPILQEYQKAYKRNYARISNRKMTNEEFRLWVDEATQKRDIATEQYQNNPNEQILIDFKEYLGNK